MAKSRHNEKKLRIFKGGPVRDLEKIGGTSKKNTLYINNLRDPRLKKDLEVVLKCLESWWGVGGVWPKYYSITVLREGVVQQKYYMGGKW